jgi:hypothetical protein
VHAGYRDAAARLGLEVRPPDATVLSPAVALEGVSCGHAVRIRRLGTSVETEVELAQALDLGLDVAPAASAPHPTSAGLRFLGRFFGRADLHDGGELHDALSVHGDEAVRVRALLEPLRPWLAARHRSGRPFHLTDALVSLRRPSASPFDDGAEALGAELDQAIDLARRVETQAGSLAPAAALGPHAAELRAFAGARGLAFTTTPLAAWGVLGGRAFRTRAWRTEPHAFTVALSFDCATPRAPGSVKAEGAYAAELVATQHRVALSETGLVAERRLGREPYDFDIHFEAAERAVIALESATAPRGAYR